VKNSLSLITAAVTTFAFSITQTASAKDDREVIAQNVEHQLIDIEVDLLIEKFSELTKRMHQLSLERLLLEADVEFESNAHEKSEISLKLKRLSYLQDRLEDERLQTRKQIHDLSQEFAEFDEVEEYDEEEIKEQSGGEELEDEIHHLRQEMEDLREVGKLDRAKQLHHRVEELIEHLSKRKRDESESNKKTRHFKKLMEERSEAAAHLEELHKALEKIEMDSEGKEEERDTLERKADEVEELLDGINRKLEELEAEREEEK